MTQILCPYTFPNIFKISAILHGTADGAAEEVVDQEPTDDFMPFSDLKHLTAKYIHQAGYKIWDEAVVVSNKLHEILP